MKPKKCWYNVLTLFTLMLLHSHGEAMQNVNIIGAANQCNLITSQTDPMLRRQIDLTCFEVFRALDRLSLNTGCPGWSDAKCRLISPGDAIYQCSVKVPNQVSWCGVVQHGPQTIFDCAPALRPADPSGGDRPQSRPTSPGRADKGKAPVQGRGKSRRIDSGSAANPFYTAGSTQSAGFSYAGGSPYARAAPFAGGSSFAEGSPYAGGSSFPRGSSYPGGAAPQGYTRPGTPQYTTHSDPTKNPNFTIDDLFRDDPSLDSIFENTTPAAAPLIPPPGYITDESFDVGEMLGPSFGQNAPFDIPQLPLSPPIPTSPLFPSSPLRPSYGQNPPWPQITPYSGYNQGGDGSVAPSSPPRSSSGVRRSPSGGEGGAPDTVDWRCPECGKSFHNKDTINVHKYNHSAVRKGYTTCRKCRQVFDTLQQFINHINSHLEQDGIWVLTCDTCHLTFKSEISLRKHEAENNHGINRRSLACTKCKRTFENQEALSHHQWIHEAIDHSQHKCLECLQIFASAAHYNWHFQAKHGLGAPPPPRPPVRQFVCDTCGDSFDNPVLFKRHQPSHTGELVCPVCWKFFSAPYSKQAHMDKKHQGHPSP
ncbi:unnamed protein product [Bemisia tabaci]|uniref:C2H2-type domain-containing protein n=1 Tax=Bemisia tabaci TaxID=7038 RepID=A0A9P0F6S9_BEMTA|nr:unnamed protein product [Bemisia tabaci]